MKNIFLVFFLFLTVQGAQSFVLTWSNPPRFPTGTISIKINTAICSKVESYTAIEALVKEAVDDYWNQVYSTSINFKVDGYVTVGNTSTALRDAADDTIVVGCADIGNTTTFAAASLTCMQLNGNCINAMGYMYINDNTGSPWVGTAHQTKVAILAHELGHAIGIGHSDKSYALMYYQTNSSDIQYYLSEDDADAATFLYPDDPQLLGLGGNCGAVASTVNLKEGKKDQNNALKYLSPLFGLLLGILFIFIIKRFLAIFTISRP